MTTKRALGSSFRDPAGFVFQDQGVIKRAVTRFGQKDYDQLKGSGLYERLIQNQWLVPHAEDTAPLEVNLYKILVPERIPVITYPYEWCSSQLKEAALLTLKIQLLALEHDMSLEDANPFNIQWKEGSPVLIDTLSFEPFKERPWFAYRQFCETFLAPLVLMAHVKADINRSLSVDLGGINLSFCSRNLPFFTWFHLRYLAHIHLHALSQEKFNCASDDSSRRRLPASFQFSKIRMVSLVRSLLEFTKGIHLKKRQTIFGDYYADCAHYSKEADAFKVRQIQLWAAEPSLARVRQVLDLGANNGKFSRIFTKKDLLTVSVDSDPYCVEENYLLSREENNKRMLPLLMDLTNPSPDLGWDTNERTSFFKRVQPDLVLALALIHHLRIGHNVPTALIADFFSKLAPALIIEFVPKSDPMVQKLLANRDDIFHDYDEQNFEAAFGQGFTIAQKVRIPDTQRTLYFLRRS